MDLVEQIRSAQDALEWSTPQLLERSGLSIDVSVLYRKLRGQSPIWVHECEALERGIQLAIPKFRLVWPKRAAA